MRGVIAKVVGKVKNVDDEAQKLRSEIRDCRAAIAQWGAAMIMSKEKGRLRLAEEAKQHCESYKQKLSRCCALLAEQFQNKNGEGGMPCSAK